jgi:isopentenyldiphosphate isomerase
MLAPTSRRQRCAGITAGRVTWNVMAEANDELLNVYDEAGGVVGAKPRREAKASGLAVGAVNVLLVNARGEVLLQRRPLDKENGGLWDKSVGGHVGAGESHDATAVRETEEELFDGDGRGRVRLVQDRRGLAAAAEAGVLSEGVVFFRAGLQSNLRDVRRMPGGGLKNVLYHVAVYLGRTDLPTERFAPQRSEVSELGYFDAADVDRMLVEGRLAPNMAFAWLAYGQRLLGLAGQSW